MEKTFPSYFNNFVMPNGAREECRTVYRACRTGKADRESFISTYEENGFKCPDNMRDDDPGVYSLSVYERPQDVKRFAAMTSSFHVPYAIAIGETNPKHGIIQPTKERTGKRTSHIDWWLYENASPQDEFSVIKNFSDYLTQYRKERS